MMKKNLKKIAFGAITAMTLLSTGAFAGQANAATMTVKPGQTLSELAKQNGTTVKAWEYTNRLQSSKITAGQTLNMPMIYKVSQGDTLSYLAKRYGTTVADIKKLNHLHGSLILAGHNLLIPVGKDGGAVKAQATVKAHPAVRAHATVKAHQAVQAHPAAAVTQSAATARYTAPESRAVTMSAPAAQPAKTVAGMAYKQQLNIVASAYGPSDEMGQFGGLTYTGTQVRQGVIAVDPNVIPLGSKVFITGYNSPNLPQAGFYATAEDIGGAIQGNRIDIFLNASAGQVQQFGLQNVKVYVLK